MWYVALIVVVAGGLIWLAGRGRAATDAGIVDDVTDAGLLVGERTVPWSSVFDVRVNTRRSFRGTWFGFDLLTEDAGALTVDGDGGRGERFLAQSHRLPGFDHRALQDALATNRSGIRCFQR